MQHGVGGMVGGLIFFVVWLGLMGCMLAGWVAVLIALWRGMKAHESIAASLRAIAASRGAPPPL